LPFKENLNTCCDMCNLGIMQWWQQMMRELQTVVVDLVPQLL
jgi:hypothetical protein